MKKRKKLSSRELARRKEQNFLGRGGEYYDCGDGEYFKAIPEKDGSIIIPKQENMEGHGENEKSD